jgi:hypothetical protein
MITSDLRAFRAQYISLYDGGVGDSILSVFILLGGHRHIDREIIAWDGCNIPLIDAQL